ncbi:hypothetical protein COV81_02595 [Candidatus Peregrinibacteria bacterium CG11_big_fil_rev_8_21_14_0_20_41_10]|nr:MAG: hypothetical protein COV81_02595 [Candidatus Peregrinibacteria bacterium CG11_big_fil_rev_8_21_14_0_20_41_10]PIZ77625.1 MAG: hypothetical protein COY06_00395 [Candidatus Peregrinibacteria bacterium CG_4_10_14_0_2_um_filter_41_8]PJC38247.1 MAG: hypothetical protein CO045_01365 [Candidatus Peregrinibacteria bacterium CG_4_9_14_0_2_um_filter_41_14]
MKKTLVTLRLPGNLLAEVEMIFGEPTKTASLVKAIKTGITAKKTLEEKMKADYASLTDQDLEFVKISSETADEVWGESDDDYLSLLDENN